MFSFYGYFFLNDCKLFFLNLSSFNFIKLSPSKKSRFLIKNPFFVFSKFKNKFDKRIRVFYNLLPLSRNCFLTQSPILNSKNFFLFDDQSLILKI